MKQNILKSLSFSLILLFSFSCKKEKGALDDLPPGRFDYVCIWNKNGIQDTLIGELSGPYLQGGHYNFKTKSELEFPNVVFRLFDFENFRRFNVVGLNLDASITSCEHDSDHLWVNFQKGDTISGSFTLTRKQ
ncbi:hypothetical protein D3C71_794870 [compost metagenome]